MYYNVIKIITKGDNMNYEIIILELLSRIKMLEEEVGQLKSIVYSESSVSAEAGTENSQNINSTNKKTSNKKLTEEMIDLCYSYGKASYEDKSLIPWNLADKVSDEAGMNRNSAFIYICAVKSMLSGTIFKRAISIKAIRKYLTNIQSDYGKHGLLRAIKSIEFHAEYRKGFHHPVDSIENLCKEFKSEKKES